MRKLITCLMAFTLIVFQCLAQDFILQKDIAAFTKVRYSAVDWGDYNNDGYLDLLIAGHAGSSGDTRIYKNNGGNSFSHQADIALTGIYDGDVKWGDYDNDGDLDLVLTGWSIGGAVSQVYKNNGSNNFVLQSGIALTGLYKSSADWGDYDNDGDLDLLLSGYTGSERVSKIFRNNGNNSFTDQTGHGLTGISNGSAEFGDYDRDGDLDVLLSGTNGSSPETVIHRNDGNNSFTKMTGITLTNVQNSCAVWGDFDSDGYPDIILSGWTGGGNITKIYKNNGSGSYNEQGDITLPGLNLSSATWGDYDNDGNLDFIINGFHGVEGRVSKLFKNAGAGGFTEVGDETLTGISDGFSAWGDYDNDGALDLIITGDSSAQEVTWIYRNTISVSNTAPSAPDGLTSYIQGDTAYIRWNKSTDNETPQDGLTYNVYITGSDGDTLVGSMSDIATGFRRIAACGNAEHDTSRMITGLKDGIDYTWSVQSIDNGFMASAFAPEQHLGEAFTEQTDITLPGFSTGDLAWGDYDNDSYLDILLAGYGVSGRIAKVYRNNGNNTFTVQAGISIDPLYYGAVAWGDYNNDGYLDILQTGRNISADYFSKIYRNNGNNTFSEQTGISITGVSNGSVDWGDYNNDGNLDFIMKGLTESMDRICKIYKNNGDNTFTEQTNIILPGIDHGTIKWGDYNNDGYLDILINGSTGSENISKIYKNNGNNSFTEQTDIILIGLGTSSGSWGDYNNDGYLDILLTGGYGGPNKLSIVYRNNGNNSFTEQTGIVLTGVSDCSSSWGDYDNDGYLDIFLTGSNSLDTKVTMIYKNNGDNTFSELPAINLPGLTSSSVEWGDYDNDGDLDILLAGYNENVERIAKIYKNNAGVPNTPPSPPTGLSTESYSDSVRLSWNRATDNETPACGLSYNVYIYMEGGDTIWNSMSNNNTGHRKIPALGNTQSDTTWTIDNLEMGIYYWSVQSIDHGFAGSPFATEHSFTISPAPRPEATDKEACYGETVPDLTATGENIKWYSDEELLTLAGTGNNFSTGESEPGTYIYYATQTMYEIESEPDTVTLTIHQLPSADVTDSVNVSCFGMANGSATVTPSGGKAPYSYQWDDDDLTTDPIVTGLSGETWYHVTVTDSNSCTAIDSVILEAPESMIIDLEYSEKICPGSTDGTVSVNVSGGTPPYTFSWSNGGFLSTIEDLPSGTYKVTVTDDEGCIAIDSVTITELDTYAGPKICMVTVINHNQSWKNLIVWEKDYGEGIASYNIHRIGATDTVTIGTVSFDSLSVFVDLASEPELEPHIYLLSSTDSCGNQSPYSASHTTVHLRADSRVTGGVDLAWTPYRGFPVKNYEILRGSDRYDLAYFALSNPNILSKTDLNPPEGNIYYQVGAIPDAPCYPAAGKKKATLAYLNSMSNIEERSTTGIKEIITSPVKIYPNPFDNTTTIEFRNSENQSFTLCLTDISGKICRIIQNITDEVYVLKSGDLKAGIYFIELSGPEVYRARIIIE